MKNNKIKIYPVKDKHINFYLASRNKLINRKISSNFKKITKLEHYNWWFNDKKRKSFVVEKNKKKLMILTEDIYFSKKNKFIYTGLISCLEKIDLIDLLKAVQWQNERVSLNKNSINIITVHKDNLFGNKQQKFFKFKTLDKKSVLYKEAKKVMNLNSRFNAYYKVIK